MAIGKVLLRKAELLECGMRKKSWLLTTGAITLFMVFFMAYSGVDKSLSREDKRYIPKFLEDVKPLPSDAKYAEEISFIRQVQDAVLTIAPKNDGLPHGQPREPKDLFETGGGLCYDRSRAIEKILIYEGFKTRHVAIYSTYETGQAIRSLITPGVSSHAVTEVRTQKGWLVVDSNERWISLNLEGEPISIREIQAALSGSKISLKDRPQTEIYDRPFTFIYGLYSRHGKFYPPYNFVPDVNYSEFTKNLW